MDGEQKGNGLSLDSGKNQNDHFINDKHTDDDGTVEKGKLQNEDLKSGEKRLAESTSPLALWVERIEEAVHLFLSRNVVRIKRGIYLLLLVLYLVYFTYCMQYRFGDQGSIILLVITVFVALKLFFKYLDSRRIKVGPPRSLIIFLESDKGKRLRRKGRILAYILASAGILVFLIFSVFLKHPGNIQPFVGMFVIILLCFVFSAKPSKVNWYPVFWSFVLQFLVATLTLRTQIGYDIFQWLGDRVENLLSFADDGAKFVIGEDFRDWGIAFTSTGLIIFINGFLFLMTHLGVIEFVVLNMGSFLAFCLETGPVESVVAGANIFLGITEAPLLIRPYLPTVTDSELHSIMTCGFASIAGGTLAMFIDIGAPANHLLTAAVISAPAALAVSKLMYPETQRVAVEDQQNIRMVEESDTNALNVYSEGAVMGIRLASAIFSNLLAFVSMLALLDAICVWAGERAGVDGLTFSVICSYLLYPIAFAMGVDTQDCKRMAKLMGVRWFSTPFVAYSQLGDLIENRKAFEEYMISSVNNTWYRDGDDVILMESNVTLEDGFIEERTEVIATYALCGYSAFTAIGITMGSLASLCPARKPDILKLVTRAFVAGNVASFATGAVAGVLFTPENTAS